MVQLILSSTKGNQGGKYFPYIGYLGLTPVRVEGIVRTKLDSDQKTLPSKSLTISVRCYESRVGRVNTLHSNILVDYTQTLWSKPDDVDYENVGVLEYPFRIWIPTQTRGFSTAVFVDYRCTWRVEAILSHAPITGVGFRQVRHFELPLVRYDVPRPLRLPDSQDIVLDHQTSKPKAPRIRYSLRMPAAPTGPLDLVSIPLHMQPLDHGVSIRSASVIIERRIQLHDLSAANTPMLSSSPPSSLPSTAANPPPNVSSSPALPNPQNSYFPSQHDSPQPPHASSSHYHHQPTSSTSSLTSSNPTITPETVYPSNASVMTYSSEHPLLSSSTDYSSSSAASSSQSAHHTGFASQPPTPNGAHGQSSSQTPSTSSSYSSPFSFTNSLPSRDSTKVVVNLIVGTETENFTRDSRGIWSKTLTLQWPASKSHSRWAIGETINSDLVSVRFFITVSSPSGGTDTIELAEKELLVVSTNESERQLALAKYAELAESSSGAAISSEYMVRSKSKSPRRLKDGKLPPDLPPSPALPPGSGGSRKPKTPRRPHTSAGPRDKSSLGKNSGGVGSTSTVGVVEQHRKRRSDLGWAHPSLHPNPQNPDYNSLWDGYARVETSKPLPSHFGNRDKMKSSEKKEKEKKPGSSSGRLSSNSFWAVTAPPLKPNSSGSRSSSSREDKGTRSAGAVMSTASTSTTGSTSSASSSFSGAGVRHRYAGAANGQGYDGEIGLSYSSSGTDEEEERRRRRFQHHQQGNAFPSLSSSPPTSNSSFPPSSYHPREMGGGNMHVREWEEELARIEEKSRKESDAAGFGRMRKRSLMSAVKGFLSSGNSSS
ncbi:hypothetical protein CC1G_10819 [Coprinopsis cinerea okayama7|uniref:Uncharacterized protein n=1 Tax=Coprinopsis cinerea (strain Okayama-7 / 130 / ATCC MYA-4618 / FGSC 9003) TaxID=240176 RepID=A8NHG4_COPC7|nr:hypothetical protein CC1G_10819 [Coprinopsis cinerea okayama7\|eukprot:XP_001833754.2 hypothetical protein CC1G_10819 [Coprinopsis cinerea okayama7\